MSPRRKTVSVAALAAAVGLVSGIAGGAAKAIAWSDARTEAAAHRAVEPLRSEFHAHLADVSKALGPGGLMHDFRARSEMRDAFLVDAVAALCAANPRAKCPQPGRLVAEDRR